MSQDFTQENKALELKLSVCRTSEELADVLRAHQIANGRTPLQDRYAVPAGNVRWAEPPSAAPKVDERLMRRDVRLSDVSLKTVTAFSVTGLDFLEGELLGKRY
jgi:hypothetical protein